MHKLPLLVPEPERLTDEELFEAACRLAALGQRVAGCPGEPVTEERRAELDPVSAYLFATLHAGFAYLVGENRKRCADEAADGIAQLEAYLRRMGE